MDPVLDVICNSVPEPNADNPGFASTIEPGLVPTRTLAVPPPVGGAGQKLVDAVLEVNVPVPVPKSYVQGCASKLDVFWNSKAKHKTKCRIENTILVFAICLG